jgi:predicted phosphodiesterase
MTDLARTNLPNTTLDAIRKLQESLPEYAARPTMGMQYGEQNKYVTWKFDDKKFKQLELLHITDVQWGHVECRKHRVQEYIQWVLKEPQRFVLFGGDMIDAATVMSPGMPWENVCEPQRQVYQFCETFAPNRILGYVGGNHERRGLKTFGDLGVLIAMLLRIPYSNGKQFIDIQYGQHKPFKISLWHGGGAARTAGSKMQMLHRFMQEADSQIYLVGHLHDAMVKFDWRTNRKAGRNNIHMTKIAGAMSSSFLSHWGTYAEVAGLSPSDVLMARIILDTDGRWGISLK